MLCTQRRRSPPSVHSSLPPSFPPDTSCHFQTIARLALPRGSLLRPQAVEMLAFFVATPLPDPDSAQSPTRGEGRGRKPRWGSRVSRFGVGGVGGVGGGGGGAGGNAFNASRSPRLNSEFSGGEEESALEASAASSSTSSLADAASFVYRYDVKRAANLTAHCFCSVFLCARAGSRKSARGRPRPPLAVFVGEQRWHPQDDQDPR